MCGGKTNGQISTSKTQQTDWDEGGKTRDYEGWFYDDLFSCITSSDPKDFGVVKRLERNKITPIEDISWDAH